MNNFKKGNKVICVDPGQWTDIEKGEIYKIVCESKNKNYIYLENIRGSFFSSRFKYLKSKTTLNYRGTIK